MKLNDIVISYQLLSNIVFKTEDYELQKSTKLKIIKNKYNVLNIVHDWEAYENSVKESFINGTRYNILNDKLDKTEEEKKELLELTYKLNLEVQEALLGELEKEVELPKDFEYFTKEEFFDICNTSLISPTIGDAKLTEDEFINYIYVYLVKE